MAKRMRIAASSDFAQFTKADLLESIQEERGAGSLPAETIGSVQPAAGM